MYASGIPVGMLVDSKGPRLAVLIGAVTLGIGYYPMHLGEATLELLDQKALLMIRKLTTGVRELRACLSYAFSLF
jgi:hypothetical protein